MVEIDSSRGDTLKSYEIYYTRDSNPVTVFPTPGLGPERHGFDTAGVVVRCAYCGYFIKSSQSIINLWNDGKIKTIFIFCTTLHPDGYTSSRCYNEWREALAQRILHERDNDPTHLPFPLRPRPS